MSKILNIVPAGLNEQDRLVVNTAAKLLSFDGVEYQLAEGQLTKAHILIVDDEHPAGKQALKNSRPGQVKLIVSNKPGSAKNTIGLQRPIELGMLKSLLTKLHSRLQLQLQNQQLSQPKTQNPSKIEELTGTLFKLLLDTKEKKHILHLTSTDLPDLFIDGRNHCLATTANDAEINQLIGLPLDAIKITHMNPESFAVHSNDLSIQSLHNLLWLTGIKCSHGKLLRGHHIDKPFRLRAWPNFTRNTFIADHLKLAAVLAKQTMNLSQLAELTRISISEVINFYNAAYAVDLIEFRNISDIAAHSPRPQNIAKQGLFSKIAERLNLKNIF